MDREQMSNEENYHFDVTGFLHIPGVLNSGEVARLNAVLDESGASDGFLSLPEGQRDPFRDLLVHPHLVWYLNQIIAQGFKLERLPQLLGSDPQAVGQPLEGGGEPRDSGTAYFFKNGRRHCQGVRVIWALSDVNAGGGGFVLVPHTHKANVEVPEDVLTGSDDIGLTQQPAMKAGDLLIVGLSTTQGIRPWATDPVPRLLSFEYTGRGIIRSAGTGPFTETAPRPDWHADLTDEQRSTLHTPGYQDTTPPPTTVTDGQIVRVDATRHKFHPSIYSKSPDSHIDEKEFFFWDLCGYLVLRNVMDQAWLEEANAAVDALEDRIVEGTDTSGGHTTLAGTGRPELKQLLSLPEPYCNAFRRMIAHPVVEHRLNWMGASGVRTGNPSLFASVKGTSGHSMHGNAEPINPSRQYVFQNGRSYCEAVTATWQLRDVTEEDGGFCCVPGSHKTNYSLPAGVTSLDEPMGLVKHIGMKAGDVLFFADGATCHGTYPWKGELSRRGVLIKYSSRSFNRSGGDLVHPENRWGDIVEGMTDAQLTVMRGPDRDNFGRNVPRLDVTDGEVTVNYERGRGLYSKDTPIGPVAKR